MTFTEQIKRAIAITKKDIRIYYSKGPVIIFGLLFPFFLFLAYTIGREISARELMPGLIGMTVFFTSTSIGPGIIPWETRSKTFERLICCPVEFWAILLGDMFSSVIFGTMISIIPVIFTLLFLGLDLTSFIIVVLSLILASLCFSALGVLLSSYPPTDIPATAMMLSSLVKFPMVFVSGIFIPVERLPYWGRVISSISPLTYFTDITRHLILKNGYYMLPLDFLAIVLFTAFFVYAAIKMHERTLPQRIS